jgi:hypothetical protein
MDTETVRVLIGGGFFFMLIVLRLEASRFGAAEYDEPANRRGSAWTRISWYLIGLALLGGLYVVHPAPHDVLSLMVGHAGDAFFFGAIVALLGLCLAAVVAWLRYGYLRLPAPGAYPGAGLNAIATSVIDEATFRGALLGTLLAIGLPEGGSIVLATIAYLLVTRLAAPGHHWSMLLLAAFVGVACGWVTVSSGGLGAAILGHAVTSFGLFVFTGHAGQVPVAGGEPEELAMLTLPPPGWQDVRLSGAGRGAGLAAERPALAEAIGPSGFSSRAERKPVRTGPAGLIARMRNANRKAGPADRQAGSGAGRASRPSR